MWSEFDKNLTLQETDSPLVSWWRSWNRPSQGILDSARGRDPDVEPCFLLYPGYIGSGKGSDHGPA